MTREWVRNGTEGEARGRSGGYTHCLFSYCQIQETIPVEKMAENCSKLIKIFV